MYHTRRGVIDYPQPVLRHESNAVLVAADPPHDSDSPVFIPAPMQYPFPPIAVVFPLSHTGPIAAAVQCIRIPESRSIIAEMLLRGHGVLSPLFLLFLVRLGYLHHCVTNEETRRAAKLCPCLDPVKNPGVQTYRFRCAGLRSSLFVCAPPRGHRETTARRGQLAAFAVLSYRPISSCFFIHFPG